jgi:phosphoenolpyruvate carboxykinase (GTP)
MGSEKTAAAFGGLGDLRRDPMAMLPFCGYNMGDYFAHWLSMPERTDRSKLPRIFGVNWFRKGEDGKFIWPGYGENSRVLKWVFERCEGTGTGTETPIGTVPSASDLDLDGLNLKAGAIEAAVAVDADDWREELGFIREHFDSIGERMPEALRSELAALESRLG